MDDDIEIEIDSSGREFAHGTGKKNCFKHKNGYHLTNFSQLFRKLGMK